MYDDLKTLVKSILQLYIKQSVIDNCSNAISYKNIDLLNKSHIELAIAKLLKKYIATSVEIEVFKSYVNNCSFCKVFKSCGSKSSISVNTFQIFDQSFGIS